MPLSLKMARRQSPVPTILESLAGAGRIASRQLLALAGGPGSGKSTLAAELVSAINGAGQGPAAHIPMDGFHMKQAKLDQLGLAPRKGAPETFEASAFVSFLSELRHSTAAVTGPAYSRVIEDVVEEGYVVRGETRLLVVEGNYLLLDTGPWQELRTMFDLAVFLEISRSTVRRRLQRRHAAEGLFTSQHIARHIERVDLPNHDLVRATRHRADLVIALE